MREREREELTKLELLDNEREREELTKLELLDNERERERELRSLQN